MVNNIEAQRGSMENLGEIRKRYRMLKLFCIYIMAIVIGLVFAVMFEAVKVHATVFYLAVIIGLFWYIKKENIAWRSWFGKVHKEGVARIVVSALFVIFLLITVITLRTAVWMEGLKEEFKFDVFAFIGSCCLAPLTEELVCRGIIFDLLREKHSNTYSVIISSIIFYVIHGNLMNIGTLFFGVLTGWMVIKTKSIVPGVIMHFIWNSVIFFLPAVAAGIGQSL